MSEITNVDPNQPPLCEYCHWHGDHTEAVYCVETDFTPVCGFHLNHPYHQRAEGRETDHAE